MTDALPIYVFDEADAELSLLPMAARRALDCAGLHLSLAGWQKLSLSERRELVRMGAAERVDRERVVRHLADRSADIRPVAPLAEAALDAALLEALPAGHALTQERWCQLSALDRYVLAQLARRGKRERLAVAYGEIVGDLP